MDREALYDAIRGLGYTTHGQTSEVLDAIMPLIEASQQRALSDAWQPIETAPRDGTYVLLACEGVVGSWVGRFQQFAVSGYRFDDPWRTMMLNHDHMPRETRYKQPTHWQPMPAILAASSGSKGGGE